MLEFEPRQFSSRVCALNSHTKPPLKVPSLILFSLFWCMLEIHYNLSILIKTKLIKNRGRFIKSQTPRRMKILTMPLGVIWKESGWLLPFTVRAQLPFASVPFIPWASLPCCSSTLRCNHLFLSVSSTDYEIFEGKSILNLSLCPQEQCLLNSWYKITTAGWIMRPQKDASCFPLLPPTAPQPTRELTALLVLLRKDGAPALVSP